MGQPADIKELYRRRNRRRLMRRAIELLVLTGLVVLLLLFIQADDKEDFTGGIANFFDNLRAEQQFPVVTSAGRVASLGTGSNQLVLLGDNSLDIYTAKGLLVLSVKHGYYNPVAKVRGKRVLLYDQGGRGLRVHSGQRELYYATPEQNILLAELSGKGQLAVISESVRAPAHGVVYDSSFNKIYEWYNENTVTALAMSDSDNIMAASTVDVVDGVLTSYINLYKLTSDQVVAKIALPGEYVLSLAYRGDSQNVYAVTDRAVHSITSSGQTEHSYSYGGEELWAFENNPDGLLAVILGDYQEQRRLRVYRLDDRLAPSAPAILREHLLRVHSENGALYILTDNVLYKYDSAMALQDVFEVPDARAAVPLGREVFYATSAELAIAQKRE